MPPQASKAAKVSLYRLLINKGQSLELGIQKKYVERDDFSMVETDVAGCKSLFVYGIIPNEDPKWAQHARQVASVDFSVSNQTSAGLLIVRLNEGRDYSYCLSWSMGHIVVNSTFIDDGFGLRFALRKGDSKSISSLTSHALETVPRTARTSVFGGSTLDAFGLEEIGEIVSRFVGGIEAEGLTCSIRPASRSASRSGKPRPSRVITVRGSDALGMPLALSPVDLISDLNLIDRVLASDVVNEEFKHLEDTQPLRPGNGKIPNLEERLAAELHLGGSGIALCWPAEFDEDPGEIARYKILGTGNRRGVLYDELTLEYLTAPLDGLSDSGKVAKLRSMRIQGQSEDGSALTREIPADKWILFQTYFEDRRFVLHRGRWYHIGGAYLDLLKSRLERIFKNRCDIKFPAWPKQEKKKKDGGEYVGWADEKVYNDKIVGVQEGYVSLDRKMIKTKQHPRGFESCDFLTPDGRLVHVKRLDDSVAASHLFNQAANSAEALVHDDEARAKFCAKVNEVSAGARSLPGDFKPTSVVIAFAGRKSNPEDLFTFSQVSLNRCARDISSLGLNLEISIIEESEDIFTDSDQAT
nr:DUF6119 family protein [Amycolatopsis sp. YIM 10]